MDRLAIVLGLSFVVIWSSAFTSASVAVQYAPPLGMLSLRFLISGMLALWIARLMGQRLDFTTRQWWMLCLFGLCQNVLYLGLNFMAMQRIEASVAVVIASALPLVVAAVRLITQGESPGRMGSIGLALGFLGVIVIMALRISAGIDLVGVILCLIGVSALTLATLVITGATRPDTLIPGVAVQMLFGGLVLAGLSAVFETLEVTWTWQLGVAFAYTTLVPGLLATLIWFYLVHRVGPTKASSFHFLNPFFGVAIAAIILGESLSALDLLGVCIVAVGIYLVQRSQAKATARQ